MKRIHWLLLLLALCLVWLAYTILTFDPTCDVPAPGPESNRILLTSNSR